MTPSEVLELARDSSLVLARDLNLPQDDVRAAFETIRAAEESNYSVLYTVTGQDEKSRNWMAVLCRSMHEAAKMQETIDGSTHVGVYALQKAHTTSTTNTNSNINTSININTTAISLPRRSRPSLLPGGPLLLRNYNVVSREEAERRAATSAVAPPTPPVKPVEPTAPIEAGGTESVPEINTGKVREELQVTRLVLTAVEVVVPAIKEEVPQQKVKVLPKESVEKKKKQQQQQQQTLFGSMLSGEKHARESTVHSTKAEPKTKKPRRAKASDETFNKNTTSLLKLAKASKKNNVNTGDLTKTTSTTKNSTTNAKKSSTYKYNGQALLDEDEELDDCNGNSSYTDNNSWSRSNSFSRDREFMNEEQQNLDIVITSVTNDDIIICDDAPPMVFCAPDTSISPMKKEQQQQKQQQKQYGAVTSLDQPKLTGFFHPEVKAFQNRYIRDVKTETVFENDEYISRDVVYYRHKENGELISEEEYHRRSIEVRRKLCEKTQKINSTSCTPSDATSPAAESKERTYIEAARNCRPPNIERQVRSQPKTLMSYFKSASS
ncbi:hypothetical protein LSM04_009174 [Trypanosoma melophagium]|uniref:uncharacterized protein n=1 Tax=Trypanosoma melophagium TaxID=715481 RepID=UPI00351A6F31|nr:hypothetical protein LSM04_009174 [Trypanosoma melophagium]